MLGDAARLTQPEGRFASPETIWNNRLSPGIVVFDFSQVVIRKVIRNSKGVNVFPLFISPASGVFEALPRRPGEHPQLLAMSRPAKSHMGLSSWD